LSIKKRIAMIRIWNYSRSRFESNRGVNLVSGYLDDTNVILIIFHWRKDIYCGGKESIVWQLELTRKLWVDSFYNRYQQASFNDIEGLATLGLI
jgi:hypothetical protein